MESHAEVVTVTVNAAPTTKTPPAAPTTPTPPATNGGSGGSLGVMDLLAGLFLLALIRRHELIARGLS